MVNKVIYPMIKGICKWNFCCNILAQMDGFWRLGLLVTCILWLLKQEKNNIESLLEFFHHYLNLFKKSKGNRLSNGDHGLAAGRSNGRVLASLCLQHQGRPKRHREALEGTDARQILLWPFSGMDEPMLEAWQTKALDMGSVKNVSIYLFTIYLPASVSLPSTSCWQVSIASWSPFPPGEFSSLALLYIQVAGPDADHWSPCCWVNWSCPAAGNRGDTGSKAPCQCLRAEELDGPLWGPGPWLLPSAGPRGSSLFICWMEVLYLKCSINSKLLHTHARLLSLSSLSSQHPPSVPRGPFVLGEEGPC